MPVLESLRKEFGDRVRLALHARYDSLISYPLRRALNAKDNEWGEPSLIITIADDGPPLVYTLHLAEDGKLSIQNIPADIHVLHFPALVKSDADLLRYMEVW